MAVLPEVATKVSKKIEIKPKMMLIWMTKKKTEELSYHSSIPSSRPWRETSKKREKKESEQWKECNCLMEKAKNGAVKEKVRVEKMIHLMNFTMKSSVRCELTEINYYKNEL